MTLRVYIGFDEREAEAARVAAKTLREVTRGEIEPEFLRADKLAAHGLLTRITDHRGPQMYDLVSNAVKSTAFAVSRFTVPVICQDEWALFVDADVVFREDPRVMLAEAQAQAYPSAVYVVQHRDKELPAVKMDGQVNQPYGRKLWSSVMLFRCGHAANQRLTLWDINHRPGRWLHQFGWLNDSEIGGLDPRWNVLIGVDDVPASGGVLHWTLGGPFTPGWAGGPHDDIWLEAAK